MTRNHRLAAAIGSVLLLMLWWFARGEPSPTDAEWSRTELLDAIRYVESGWRENVPDGDDGLAIGPYQIHRVYWLDAIAHRPEIGGDYQDCRNRAYAERVIEAYMQFYVADAWERIDAEIIARTHNGGPLGAQKEATLRYWQRVRRARE